MVILEVGEIRAVSIKIMASLLMYQAWLPTWVERLLGAVAVQHDVDDNEE